jgi:hypothetical protein
MKGEEAPGSAGTDEPAEFDAEQLRRLAPVPSGAAALAGVAVLLLLVAWLLIYLMVYLPRGMVG